MTWGTPAFPRSRRQPRTTRVDNPFAKQPTGGDDDPRVMALAERIAARHGPVALRQGRKGLHLEFASPACLDRDGEIELIKRHGSLNVDRYLRRHPYQDLPEGKAEWSARCMKTQTSYRVADLLQWRTLAERELPTPSARAVRPAKPRKLTRDRAGNEVPFPAGELIPLTFLPSTHPCIQYVRYRGFSPETLQQQFSAAFCVKELAPSTENGRFYRRLPGTFRETPQGRLVFRGKVMGVDRGWQARILDYKDEQAGIQYFLHPDTFTWVPVNVRQPDGSWDLRSDWIGTGDWTPSRYMTAPGSFRGELLLGFDAALRWNAEMNWGVGRVAILTEGPLDAARFGPPAMPILGKSLSDGQAELLKAAGVTTIVFAAQRDSGSGQQACDSVRKGVSSFARFFPVLPPEPLKDFGDMITTTPDQLMPWIRTLVTTPP